MTRANCTTEPRQLLEYWLGELDQTDEARMDEHLFACATCTERLDAIVALGAAIRGEVLRGGFGFVVPTPYMRTFEEAGLHVRKYELTPGDSVSCTVTPDDDFVVSILHAPLHDVHRLDVLIEDTTAGKLRLNDVPFDPGAPSVAVSNSVAFLRTLGRSRQHVKLVAVDGANERVLGDYTFKHYPS
jgi:hypothetical protein